MTSPVQETFENFENFKFDLFESFYSMIQVTLTKTSIITFELLTRSIILH